MASIAGSTQDLVPPGIPRIAQIVVDVVHQGVAMATGITYTGAYPGRDSSIEMTIST
jgi:hypothetical protein